MIILYSLGVITWLLVLIALSSLWVSFYNGEKKSKVDVAIEVSMIVTGVIMFMVVSYYEGLVEDKKVIKDALEGEKEGYVVEKRVKIGREQVRKEDEGVYMVSNFKWDSQGVLSTEQLRILPDDVSIEKEAEWTLVYQEIDKEVMEDLKNINSKMFVLFEDTYYLGQEGYVGAEIVSE